MDPIDFLRVNNDRIHQAWLDEYEQFALKRLSNGESKKASIITDPLIKKMDIKEEDEDLFIYGYLGDFGIPSKSADLILKMAYFSKVWLVPPDKIYDYPKEVPDFFPETTFSLEALLTASLPRNPIRGTWTLTQGGVLVDQLDYVNKTEEDEIRDHYAFSGLGVFLLKQLRRTIGEEFLTDAETMERAEGCFIAIF